MSSISRRTVLGSATALPFLTVPGLAKPAPGSYGMVRRQAAALDALVDVNAMVEQIGWGYTWAEGPVWVKDGGYLLFSDPQANAIYQWMPPPPPDPAAAKPADTAAAQPAPTTDPAGATPDQPVPVPPAEFLKPSGYAGDPNPGLREPGSNGLAIDASGALVMCDSGTRAVAKVDLKTKQKTILADKFEGKKFNSPNDLCIAKSGAIYFTDPPYGLNGIDASPLKEQAFCGVYRLDPNGTVTLIDKDLSKPNGIALSPDESKLYVTNSDPARPLLKAYALGTDGLAKSSWVLFDFKPMMMPDVKGLPDGLKLDQDGNLFVAGPGGILILSKEGRLLGLINVTGRASPNCAFGEDGSTLFICATDILARVRLKTKGVGW
jgi:gluconolactonase